MKLVIVESPYAGDIEKNVAYARRCLRDCFDRGEAPYASHLLFTQPDVLDDRIPEQRALGIEAGLLWGSCAALSAVYVDHGVTSGMVHGIERALRQGRSIEIRSIEGRDEKGCMELVPFSLQGRIALHQHAAREAIRPLLPQDHFGLSPRLLEALAKEGVLDAKAVDVDSEIAFRVLGRGVFLYFTEGQRIGIRIADSLSWTNLPVTSSATEVARAIVDLIRGASTIPI